MSCGFDSHFAHQYRAILSTAKIAGVFYDILIISMEKIKKIFFEQNLTWKKIILFSIICGVITGIIPLIHFLDKTSIHNIAECLEMWVLLAMFVILNSKKPIEAGLKTFVFFLISQPLCYLIQVPFYDGGFEIFRYYPYWGFLTILTFPGAILAWYTKKGTWLSALILSAALYMLGAELFRHANTFLESFPYQLLAVLFIFFEMILFIKLLFNSKKKEIVLFIFCALTILFEFVRLNVINNNHEYTAGYILGDGKYEIIKKPDNIDVVLNNSTVFIKTEELGEYTIEIKDEKDNIIILTFTAEEENSFIDKKDQSTIETE